MWWQDIQQYNHFMEGKFSTFFLNQYKYYQSIASRHSVTISVGCNSKYLPNFLHVIIVTRNAFIHPNYDGDISQKKDASLKDNIC